MADGRAIHIKRQTLAGQSATKVFHDAILGVEVFQRPGQGEEVCEMAFSGMRCKPDYSYRFRSLEAAAAYREKWLEGKRAGAAEKRARIEQSRAAGAQLAVGDVLVASWGYEQTNYNYYQVTRKAGALSVEIRELAKDVSYNAAAMAGECVPIKGRFVGAPMIKRVDSDGGVKVRSARATKKASVVVGGVDVFSPDRYTCYA
ncbi:hypothetical protein FRC97_00235 (plasmid) [Paracidovorax citrulli]|uniref:hypothetical protein n=1 Tax=Paracidovorax citrulli TaxID=80869 RepID=UPI00077D32CA|nr:hypothetical protein [Paracidovorax citrulli]QCX13189.1 hypothetical protein APS58_p00045 [Paracidovorax citrulli]UMT93564.1 hypothetical protein FRC97_00235 [Paracidovorax citrulli]